MTNIDLLRQYQQREITRNQFCRQLAAMQGFSNSIKGWADKDGTVYAVYRGRAAVIKDGQFTWAENNKIMTAATFRELKIKIDIEELKKCRTENY